jgi:tRNA(Ile)-lysidine synthase
VAGPSPSVAATRLAVRHALQDLTRGSHVVVAGSGGPDSTALAAATAFVAPRLGLTAGFACADQHWSSGSTEQSKVAVATAAGLGLEPVEIVDAPADRSEGAARVARRAGLLTAARTQGAVAILLGHTLDDQAETVLLRLARGSGARSLSAMPARDDPWRRPFLALRRELVHDSCYQLGLTTWDDPSNVDPAFARSRVRAEALPLLERALGPGVAESLARSAVLLRSDADALDGLTDHYLTRFDDPAEALSVGELAGLPAALRSRVLRRAALEAGSPATALGSAHVTQLETLVTAWRGQGPLTLPGGVTASRSNGRIVLLRAPARESSQFQEPSSSDPFTLDSFTFKRSEAAAAMTELMAGPNHSDSPPSAGQQESTLTVSPHPDIAEILISKEEIAAKVAELAALIDADYQGKSVLLVGVLKGAAMVMADLSRALTVDTTLEFMAVSSYGSSTSSSGVVRILKDLDRSIEGVHVLVVEDIIDSGLTLSWLVRNLRSRHPASVEVVALLRKPEALKVSVDVRYVGFDIPSAFVVGYGLDYAERYRTLSFVGTLTPEAIERGR